MTGWRRAAPLLGCIALRWSQSASVFCSRSSGAAAVARWENRVNKVEFENAAETEAIVMQNGMNEYICRLVALRTLFESTNEEITRSEFETFSARLFERHPGMLRISWLPRVNRKERAEYEAAAVTDGVSGYRIKSLQGEAFATAPQSDEYFPVFFSTQPKTSTVYGMDYATVPERRAALERARDNDRIAAMRTRLYEPKEGGRRPACSSPCRSMPREPRATTVADRRRNLAGFVVGIFDLPLLIQSIRVTTGASPAVGVNVYPPFTGRPSAWNDAAGLFVGRHGAAVDAGLRTGAALVGQAQDRRHRLAGARRADRRRSAGRPTTARCGARSSACC